MSCQDIPLIDSTHRNLCATWRRELSTWLYAIQYKIAFPTTPRPTHATTSSFKDEDAILLADRHELEADFWLSFTPSEAASRSDWIQWLEALELLGLLATSVSKRVCWELLAGVATNAVGTRRYGWAPHGLHEMRPRFEFRFDQPAIPSDEAMALILNGIPDADHSANYQQVRTRLVKLAAGRAYNHTVKLRFLFRFHRQKTNDRASEHCVSERRIAQGRRFGGALRALKRIQVLAHEVAAKVPPTQSTWVELVSFGFHLDTVYVSDDAREWLRAIASYVPIHWLVYGVSSRAEGIGNYYGPFLWRLLAPHPTRRAHLGLRSVSIHASGIHGPQQIIAFCSALAQSRWLEQFEFTDDSIKGSDADSQLWARWLAFALFSRVSRHSIRAVRLDLGTQGSIYAPAMIEVIQHENPVAFLAAIVDGVDLTTLPHEVAETVRLGANTKISGCDLPGESAATTVFRGNHPVECHAAGGLCGKFMRVLIPGVGFGCVERKDVETVQSTTRVGPHALRSLSLRVRKPDLVAFQPVLHLVGESLTTFQVRSTGRCDRNSSVDLESLLSCCPRLRRVCLESMTIPLRSLTHVNWGRNLESLALRTCRVLPPTKTTVPHSPGAETIPSLRLFPQLTSLYVGTGVSRQPIELQEFLLTLDSDRDLERFLVETNDVMVRDRYNDHTKLRNGLVVPGLRPRHKLAFLSVVSTSAPNRGFQLDPDTITHIFKLAARPTHDRISTLR